jgi:hypothetical protein
MADLILTHAADAAGRAKRVAARLEDLGYTVRTDLEADGALSPHSRRKLNEAIAQASCVLVLWSKDASAAPALLAAAAQAKASGKLALARLDAAAPPANLAGAAPIDLSGWMGRDTRPWRSLVAALPSSKTKGRAAAPRRAPSTAPRMERKPMTLLGAIGLRLQPLLAAGIMLAVVGIAAIAYAQMNGLPPEVAAQLPPGLTSVLQK